MSYEQFVTKIESNIKAHFNDGRKIYIHTAIKNNGKERKGITFVEEGVNVSPTIYLEEYYDRFSQGSSIEKVTAQILELYHQVRFGHSWEGEFVQEYTNIKDRIIYHLINRQANQELLKEVPHVPFLDLSIVFYVLIEMDPEGERMATMLIRREHLNMWKTGEEEIYRAAKHNTERLLPYEFATMYTVVEEMLDDEELKEAREQKEDSMYVLTNQMRNFGAAAILYRNRLQAVGLYLKENYYVLPSSVHEVIIVPESRAPEQKDLCAIVSEINETQVKEEEVLSNHAYYYDREKKELRM